MFICNVIFFFIQIFLFPFVNSAIDKASYNMFFNRIIQLISKNVNLREVMEEFFSNKKYNACIQFTKNLYQENGFIIKDKLGKLFDSIYTSGIIDFDIGFENKCLNNFNHSYFFLLMNEPVDLNYKKSKEYPYGNDYRENIYKRIMLEK